jgi:hypothetical protein
MSVEVLNVKKIIRELEILARINTKDRSALAKINRETGKIYVNALRSNIKNYGKTIFVRRKSGTSIDITSGTLRRSIGSWAPKGQKTGLILSGPRTNTLGRKTQKTADGWFAHFVEAGTFPSEFGGKQSGNPNHGVFNRTRSAVYNTMKSKQISAYAKYIKNKRL